MHGIGWLGIFIFLLGGGCLLWSVTQRSRSGTLVRAAQAWPTATATIIGTDIVSGGMYGGGTTANLLRLFTGIYNARTFAPVARYEYEVGGRKYFGERIRPGYLKVGSIAAAEKILKPYPVGATVPVRYDPADPNSSVLELTTSSSPMMMMIIGGLLMLFGGALAVAAMAGAFPDRNDRSRRSRGDSGYESSRGRDSDRDRDRDRERYRDRDRDRDRDSDRRSDR
jgi:hypothetical protein